MNKDEAEEMFSDALFDLIQMHEEINKKRASELMEPLSIDDFMDNILEGE